MHTLFLTSIGLIIGLGLLAWAADRFIDASVEIASVFKMSPLMIGMVLVGFGTSFPEFVVSGIAAAKNEAGLSIGNVIGSNIANIGMCLGVTALLYPLKIHSRIVRRDYLILFTFSLFIGLFIFTDKLTRFAGVCLLSTLFGYLFWLYYSSKKRKLSHDPLVEEYQKELPRKKINLKWSVFWWLISLLLVFLSSEILVSSAVTMAKWFHVSSLFIGLTVVAIGTSLPELAATILSARKNEPDIAIGNVIGSNIFNILGVLAMPALLAPAPLAASVMHRDYPIMLVFTLLVWLLSVFPRDKNKLGRVSGLVLFVSFLTYLFIVVSFQ